MASSPPHVWPPAGTAGGSVPPVGPTFNGGLDVVVNTDGRAEAFFIAPFDANRCTTENKDLAHDAHHVTYFV